MNSFQLTKSSDSILLKVEKQEADQFSESKSPLYEDIPSTTEQSHSKKQGKDI